MTEVVSPSRRVGNAADEVVISGLSIGERLDDLIDAMLAGGVSAANWTVAAPGVLAPNDLAGVVTLIARARARLEAIPDRARVVNSADDIRACARDRVAGIIIGFQDVGPVGETLELLDVFSLLGVRIVQIAYQRRGLWGSGSGERVDAGLSDLGRAGIERMNRLGMLVDLSHCGPRTSLEAIDASSAPCAFTHTSAAALVARPRAKSDELIRRIGERSGVVGILGIAPYLDERGNDGIAIDRLVDHVVHVAGLIGIEGVGIGLDIIEGMSRDHWERRLRPSFEGLPGIAVEDPFRFDTYYPDGLRSVADTPRIAERLAARGFADADIASVMGGNFLRLFERVWPGS